MSETLRINQVAAVVSCRATRAIAYAEHVRDFDQIIDPATITDRTAGRFENCFQLPLPINF